MKQEDTDTNSNFDIHPQWNELQKILSLCNPSELFLLQDLVSNRFKRRKVASDSWIENKYNGNLPLEYTPYVRVADLPSDSIDYRLDTTKVKYCITQSDTTMLINKSVILVSLIGKKLKPAFFEYTGRSIAISSEILALEVRQDIDIEYLVYQLNSELVRLQLEMNATGAALEQISVANLMQIKLIIPSKEAQLREILEIKSALAEKFLQKLQIEKQANEIKQIEYDVIATISHNLNQKLGSLVNDLDSLTKFLQKKDSNNDSIHLSEPIAPLFEGEELSAVDTLNTVVSRLTSNLNDATQTIKAIERVMQFEKLEKQRKNLVAFFEIDVIPNFVSPLYKIHLIKHDTPMIVELDKSVFKEIIQNFVKNAVRHGFTEHRNYRIEFEIKKLQKQDGQEWAIIRYRNDGSSFPEGFSFDEFKRFAGCAGKHKGSGIGGFFINKAIELHGGFLKYIDRPKASFNVEFEIELPIVI